MPTLLLTGANRGLGLEIVRQFAAGGWTVHACCRAPQSAIDLQTAAAEVPSVTIHALDVNDFAAIDDLARELEGTAIDVLLNNAGIQGSSAQDFGNIDYGGWAEAFRINTMAPMKMAEAFTGHVAASERKLIVTFSSVLASMAENRWGELHVYRTSKTAVNMVMRTLAPDMAKRGVTAFNIHPGWVRTDMGGPNADLTPSESVAGIKQVIEAAGPAQAGAFLDWQGKTLPW